MVPGLPRLRTHQAEPYQHRRRRAASDDRECLRVARVLRLLSVAQQYRRR